MQEAATFTAQNKVQQQLAERQAFIEQVQQKMHTVANEFAAGEISREQFHRLYEHYQGQIVFAVQLLAEADGTILAGLPAGETIALRKQLTAKAKAMAVYYHATGLLLETIGDFDVPVLSLAPILNDRSDRAESGTLPPPQVKALGSDWLLFISGKYSTSIMVFSHEPAARQIAIIENMHRDFEAANGTALRSGRADASKLVYPFQSFVRKSVGMR